MKNGTLSINASSDININRKSNADCSSNWFEFVIMIIMAGEGYYAALDYKQMLLFANNCRVFC